MPPALDTGKRRSAQANTEDRKMPALVINTNVPSINGRRNLFKSTQALNKSLERLSSGLRINRAGDDAAGLAISESLRSQVRGLNQAVRNCNDGVSLIQTAEGALDTYTEIIQRMRELSIQASSDVNSDANRASIQLEVDQQIDELNRIANTISFNGAMLFDGTFVNKRIQAGADRGQFLDISVGDIRTHVIAKVSQEIGAAVDGNSMNDGDIVINDVPIPSSSTNAARDKAIAINSVSYDTGVFAKAESAQTVGTAPVAAGTLDLTNYLEINGVRIPPAGSVTVTAGDNSGALRRAINSVSDQTGVEATVDSTGALVLTSMNEDPFTYEYGTAAANAVLSMPVGGGAAVVNDVFGRVRLYSDAAFTVADGGGSAASLIGITPGAYAEDVTTSVDQIDITSFEKAQDSIFILDNALRQINDVRARLGATTNRLNNTVSNLMIVAENLSASDSRIRDADFAVETANLTKNQILQQSGVSVLAQANVTPQAALNLLQG